MNSKIFFTMKVIKDQNKKQYELIYNGKTETFSSRRIYPNFHPDRIIPKDQEDRKNFLNNANDFQKYLMHTFTNEQLNEISKIFISILANIKNQ